MPDEGLELGKSQFHNLIFCFPFNPQSIPLNVFEKYIENENQDLASFSLEEGRPERWWGSIYNTLSTFRHKFDDTGERPICSDDRIYRKLDDFAKSIAFNLTKFDSDPFAKKYVTQVIETLYSLLFSSVDPQKSIKEVLDGNREENERFNYTFGCPFRLFAPDSDPTKNIFSPEEFTEYINATVKDMFGDQVFELKDGFFVNKAGKISMEKINVIEKLITKLKGIKLNDEDEWARIQKESAMVARRLFSEENYAKQIEDLKIHYEQVAFVPGEPDRSVNFKYWEKSLKNLNIILETMKKEAELDISLNMSKPSEISKPQDNFTLISGSIEIIQKEMVQLLYNLILADPTLFKEETRSIPKHIRNAVIKQDESICQICRKKLKQDETRIDHILPYSLGGGSNLINLMVLCEECNQDKGKKKDYFESGVGREKILVNIREFVKKLPPIDNFTEWIKKIAKAKLSDVDEGAL